MSDYKIVVFGDGGVGKTAITMQFLYKQFVESYDATIEDGHRKLVTVDGQVAQLDILDTAGQEDYSALRETYMRKAEGVLMVYDTTRTQTLEELEEFVKLLHRVGEGGEIPFVVAGNKCDLKNDREVSTAEGKDFAERYKAPFFETSAKTKKNVKEVYFQLVREMRRVRNKSKKGKKGKRKRQCRIL
mmetsp:Transcript_17848/g.19879  ORF Transcript_17848/g.19879 Transcript_17848/m.19879 type:complete len:187 (+) Transcript_17848:28-588(+)